MTRDSYQSYREKLSGLEKRIEALMRRPQELKERNQALASEVKRLKALLKEKVRPRVQKYQRSNPTMASPKP